MILKIATLDRVNRKADRSISLAFTTSTEQSTQDLAELDTIHQRTCVIAIKPDESGLNKDELSALENLDIDLYDEPKSKAQRFRGVLFVMHQQNGGSKEDFSDFYNNEWEKIISHYKNKLEPR